MKTIRLHTLIASAGIAFAACQSAAPTLHVTHQNDSTASVAIAHPSTYVLLPIQESQPEAQVTLVTGSPGDTPMDIRLAVDSVDYYVPFELPKGADSARLLVQGRAATDQCWQRMVLSDTFDTANTDYYRPSYHYTPPYGWMNDANGLVYKDGEYHLYYQYNPYGSKWGNMHWGHAVSKDLMHWETLKPAIARDTLGHIFSGSTVIDHNNSAGFGKDALIAFYTSASDRFGQLTSMAYSTDNGRTYTKYDGNPILAPFDGLKDFRDPKVFWYAPQAKWVMIISADKEMRFYESRDMKQWHYMSAFGRGYGIQPNQFECPDFMEMAVDGNPKHKKWVMLVNINPGCLFGGSATEYFVGDFDGTTFRCDTKPSVTKWLDYGKDHYATVTFHNTGDRVIGMPWMSNWQYANITPIKQYRGANALPRELSLYSHKGDLYLAANVVPEAKALRQDVQQQGTLSINGTQTLTNTLQTAKGAAELDFTITAGTAQTIGFDLCNAEGEKVKMYFDLAQQRFVMDRTESGIVELGELHEYNVHEKETDPFRKTLSVNYKNDFALGTWAPLSNLAGKTYRVQVFIDVCSIEVFIDGGRIAMTNLVFPRKPYTDLRLYTEGGTAEFQDLTIYRLAL